MSVIVECWGDYAIFTRPEMKAERVSYDVITPSAARGIMDSIYWHPGMKWIIDRITVCNPIRFVNIRKNEISAIGSLRNAYSSIRAQKEISGIDGTERVQRSSMFLKNVRYIIEAHYEVENDANRDKVYGIVTRRIKHGKCYSTPYFGQRECSAYFKECETIPECPEELKGVIDLGMMLYDMDFSNKEMASPRFFHAKLYDGVLNVPSRNSEEVVE